MAQVKNCYEGMFLLDAGQPNTEAALEPVRTVLERSEAEILSIKPWDECRLAYEIQGRKRGLYVLSYFKLDAEKVTELEHDCLLNENIIRMLVLRKETVTEAELETPTPAETAPAETPPAETTPEETTPTETTPEETTPAETTPAETTPEATTPTETTPEETTPAETTPEATTPAETSERTEDDQKTDDKSTD